MVTTSAGISELFTGKPVKLKKENKMPGQRGGMKKKKKKTQRGGKKGSKRG